MAEMTMSTKIRARKLGVLIRDARLASGKPVEECALALGVSADQFTAYEYGDVSPSLPQVELLAYFLNLPVDHFWGATVVNEANKAPSQLDPARLIRLRQRIIGTLVRQARTEAGLSLDQLSAKTGLSKETLEAYELSEKEIPLPELEGIAQALNRSVSDFQDRQGPVGQWMARQRAVTGLADMPPELIAFISKPINRPYLELAQRLSEMSVEKLRAVAEGLLEITL